MGRSREYGSLTKEFPLADIDSTILAIKPGTTRQQLRQFAQATNVNIPATLENKFLLVDGDQIVYDRFLSLVNSEGITSDRVRKVMYFTQFFRDPRLREFICKRIATPAGPWRVTQITNKRARTFFEQFSASENAPSKMRSNVERFLVETRIFDRGTVRLELSDGWLEEAFQVVAQHETDDDVRRAMLADPAGFLIAREWHGLTNATEAQLRSRTVIAPLLPEPAEDEYVPDTAPGDGPIWNRTAPLAGGQPVAFSSPNPLLRERAAASHFMLEKLAAAAVAAAGHAARCNDLIDLYFKQDAGNVLCEMKSCTQGNLRHQVRRGIAQLLEYRFLHYGLLGADPTLLLAIEIEPRGNRRWLLDWIRSVGIVPAWKDPDGDRLLTIGAIPPLLAGIIFAKP
jgi:hypothetical protein